MDVGLLRRLKREFGFYSVDVVAEEGPAAGEGLAYVVGGYDGGGDLSSVERYDAASDTWSAVAPMRIARRLHCACEVAGELYVTGGYEPGATLATVEKYSPATNAWFDVAPMPGARYGHRAISVGSDMSM